ncbi:hypothetical protein F5B22DRAFT_527386 [Xylaria bambusicola]|uniref:uncharacterized protein n=1 Tax=Xylaria bambusicola TaxID=326684 RepID=UPI0020087D8B|nr:uncharacterized protein F5B22DRAFT_527386 [Xylaria bambusicola]KAI0505403.1 hypothetical protein F5B22DRAFT_527386 [Xylaria bambusicola]
MSFTLMPFLYQTRTILRIPATCRAATRTVQSFHTTARCSKDKSIPFDYELGPPNEDTPATEVPVTHRGTITPSERRVFERIFADINARGLKPAINDDDDVLVSNATTNRSARLIMEQAAYDAGQSNPSTVVAPAILSGAAKDRAKALFRFPAPLRGATNDVFETIKHQALKSKRDNDVSYNDRATNAEEADFIDDDFKAPAHSFARVLELETKRSPERTRIEGLITSATSDFELWDVLEKEVFTMPARLGIVKTTVASDDSVPLVKPKKRGRKTAKSMDNFEDDTIDHSKTSPVDDTSAASNDTTSPDDPNKLSLYVHGPLYPAYLLLALRRLDTAFSAPSPLVFSVLPRIKELGLESYVLGVSTPFFNELLTIYWTRRGDLSGMLDLLEEMRHCGLYFDKQTASILNQVDTVVYDLASAKSRSGLGKALMMMPEYELSQRERIRHWHRAVDLSARERQDDLGFVGAAHRP